MPPLTTQSASALVAGGGIVSQQETDVIAQKPAQPPQELKVEVLRAFYYQGKVQPVAAEPTLPRAFALEMAAAHKVRIIEEKKAESTASPLESKESAPASAQRRVRHDA